MVPLSEDRNFSISVPKDATDFSTFILTPGQEIESSYSVNNGQVSITVDGVPQPLTGVLIAETADSYTVRGDSTITVPKSKVLFVSQQNNPEEVHHFSLKPASPSPAEILVEVYYRLPNTILGWTALFEALVTDSRVELQTVLQVENQLDTAFLNARIIFSSFGRDSGSTAPPSYHQSSSKISTSSNIFSKSRARVATSTFYDPALEYYALHDSHPITLRALSSFSLNYHHNLLPFNASAIWLLFNAASAYPQPGAINLSEHAAAGTLSDTLTPFVVDVENTIENGFGLDLPAGHISTFAQMPSSLQNYSLAPPIGKFSFTGSFSASSKGEHVYLPIGKPLSPIISCTKVRTSFRSNARSIVEAFTYTIHNTSSIQPLNVIVHDCAFRHTDWYIIRSSHEWQRNNINFFSFSIPNILLNSKVEVSFIIEYSFTTALPQESAPASSEATPGPQRSQPKVPHDSTKKGGLLGSLFS